MNRDTIPPMMFLLVTFSMSPVLSQTDQAKQEEAIPGGVLPAPLEFVQRFSQNYNLTFAAQLDAERFQLTREQTANYSRQTHVLKIGDTSADGVFRVDKYEKKEGISALGVIVDTSELTITRLETDEQFVLTRKVTETLPTWYAKLRRPNGAGTNGVWEEFIKLGDSFNLPESPKKKFTLVSAEKDQVTLEFRDASGKLRSAELKRSE